ncbi:MAG: molybdenum cofactor biosynthesis protein MoaE [Deltaproteobacteria bacterium]|nr:molybdenum cofactor biosynthesis protein MoaE [Deltaproteobacteria bacterium]
MKIQLLAFASARDAIGSDQASLTLPEGSTLSDLRDVLQAQYPDLEPLWPRLAIAVEGELAPPSSLLRDGVEVALLPPVSGGAPSEGGRERGSLEARVGLVEDAIDVPGLLATLKAPSCGAVLLFLGTVRDHHQGRPVVRLTYSAYRSMAESRLLAITRELEAASSNLRLGIVHRLGEVPVGEPSVAIASASPHREEAYEGNRLLLERLKAEVPIWKREHYGDGEAAWREEESLLAPSSAL